MSTAVSALTPLVDVTVGVVAAAAGSPGAGSKVGACAIAIPPASAMTAPITHARIRIVPPSPVAHHASRR
jgi:hypothetical protein